MFRAFIFDMDGVLVDSEPLHEKAWKILFAERGLQVSDTEYKDAIGKSDSLFLSELFSRHNLRYDIKEFLTAKKNKFRELLESNFRPYPGAKELVQRLSRNYLLALVSSEWMDNILYVLNTMDIRELFTSIISKDTVQKHKPDPEPYLRALSELGVSAREAVAIEDSPSGVKSAKSAGLYVVAVCHTLQPERLTEADFVLESLENSDYLFDKVLCFTR